MKRNLKDLFKSYWGHLIALAVLTIVFFRGFPSRSLWPDEALYIELALRVRENPLALFTVEVGKASFAILPVALFALFPFNVFLWIKVVNLLFALLILALLQIVFSKDKFYRNLAAVLVVSSPIFLFFTTRALTDIPGAAIPLIAYYLFYLWKRYRKRIFLALAGFLPPLIKLYGIFSVIIPVIALAVEYKEDLTNLKLRRFAKDVTYIFLGVLLGFVAYSLLVFRSPLPVSPGAVAKSATAIKNPEPFMQFRNLLIVLNGNLMLYLLFFASVIFWTYQRIENPETPLAVFSFTLLLFLEFFVGEKVPRYLLPVFTAGVIPMVSLIGEIENFLDRRFRKYYRSILLLFFGFSLLTAVNAGIQLIELKAESYTGYFEIGQKLCGFLENLPENAKVMLLASSKRAVKGVTALYGCGNKVKVEGIPKDFRVFVDLLREQKPAAVEWDIWEYTAPNWFREINQSVLKILNETSYIPIMIAEREVGGQKLPVIAVFWRAS